MSFRLDEDGNAVTEPFKSIREVLQWVPNELWKSSHSKSNVHTSLSHSNEPGTFKAQSSGPQLLVCHDMCGGYLEDRFSHGCSKSSPYAFYHWQLIDIFIYFSHTFVTIPPIGWIKAARKHGVTVLGTVITEWYEGANICKELLTSDETIDQLTTKLAQLALFHGFNGWLINIENKVEIDQVLQLQKFVHQLTLKCRHLLGVSKVLWYDSVISTGELKWQDELNSFNEMFFTVSDGIFLNYLINEEKLSRSWQMSSACGRELDVFVGVDVFGRGTPGGGGFNTIETVRMVLNQGLSCALFAPGWVYEHLGPEQFDTQEIMFWGILSEMLTPRPVEVPFATSFCRGFGDRYYIHGQVLTDSPWYNLSLQQVQPNFTHSQFASYTVSKIRELVGTDKDGQQVKQKEQFRVEVESCEKHQALPQMMFDMSVGYFGGGSLRLTARRLESKPVLFRLFALKTSSEKSLRISVTWNLPMDSACLGGLVLSAKKAADGEVGRSSAVVCTVTDLSCRHRDIIQNMLLQPKDSLEKDFLSTSVHFVTGVKDYYTSSEEGGWITWSFNVDKSCLLSAGCQNSEFVLSAILIPLELKDKDKISRQMCAHIGYLQVSRTAELIPIEKDSYVRSFKCLEVKVSSPLSKEIVDQIVMHPCFGSDDEHLVPIGEVFDGHHQMMKTAQKYEMDLMLKADKGNRSLDVSRHTADLSSLSSVLSAMTVTSAEGHYTLYVLKWDILKDDVDFYLMFSYSEAGVKRFIGHAVEKWFVWKRACEDEKIAKFSVQPITSSCNLAAEEVYFCA